MDREEVLGREDEAWRRFAETVRAVPADRRDVEGVVPGWTVHDLVWHVAYWAGYADDVIERDRAGDTDVEPVDSELEEAEILATGRGMSWDGSSGARSRGAIEYGPPSRRRPIPGTPPSGGSGTTRSTTSTSTRPRSARSSPDGVACARPAANHRFSVAGTLDRR